jgi:hypothetical protein
MLFFGFDASGLADVDGVLCLLSAAEMLQQKLPKIYATFIHYSSALVTNFIAENSTQGLELAAAPLRSLAQSCRPAPVAEVERFGDSLVAGADGDTALAFNRLAYLAYCATSMYGPMTPRISNKIQRLAQAFSSGNFSLGASFFGGGLPHQSTGFGSSFSGQQRASPARGTFQAPPVYTPQQPFNQAGPPVFTPQQPFDQSLGPSAAGSGPPVFTPGAFTSQGGMRTFTSSVAARATGSPARPPVFTPQQSVEPEPFQLQGGLPGQFAGPQDFRQSAPEPVAGGKVRQLAELALAAFSAGSSEIALTALMGAVTEAQK